MTKAVTGLCMGCMSQLQGQDICPHCGYSTDHDYDQNYIKPGSVLSSRYIVGKLAHRNGEGAQYVGYDNSVQMPVWIQEYFPYTIAQRQEDGSIRPAQGYGAQYKALMSDFVDICNEVRRLSITEPVVPIENVITENNTVYAIYRDLDIVPLESWLQERGGKLPLDETLEMFVPLLNTLSNIHGHGQLHRGISPYTVYVDENARLILWDFALSATRTANSELQAELWSGYSAPEQYSPSGWQGTWTDVYAVGALLYRTLSGVVPPKSTLIGPARPLVPLTDLVMNLTENVSGAISGAMKTSTESRTQAIATLTSRLMQNGSASTAVYDTNRMNRNNQHMRKRATEHTGTVGTEEPKRRRGRSGGVSGRYIALALGLTVVVLVALIVIFMYVYYPNLISPNSGSRDSSQTDYSSMLEEDPDQQSQLYTGEELPRFVGRTAEAVMNDPQYEGRFEFSLRHEFDETYAEGIIYDQSPLEGTKIDTGTIILYVSKGTEMIEMPDLIGKTLKEATDLLGELGSSIQIQTFEKRDPGAEPGTIVSTSPNADEEFDPKRRQVYLFITPEQSEPEPSSSSSVASQPPPSSSSSSGSSDGRNFFHYTQ